MPGARAGEGADDAANNQKLLAALAGVPEPRTARFVAAIALCRPGRPPLIVRGTCEGEIGHAAVGEDGFGYDPLFFSPAHGQTFAQLSPAEKNAASHRAQALARLRAALTEEGT